MLPLVMMQDHEGFDAATIYDGSSMVAFTGTILAFVALKNQIAAKRSVKPVGMAFVSGAGIGAGVGLLNLYMNMFCC